MIKQGKYGLVVIEGSSDFCGSVGYYDSDDIDDNEFPGAIVLLGSPFNHDDSLIFEYADLRPVTYEEHLRYMLKHEQIIQKNADIIERIKLKGLPMVPEPPSHIYA